MLSVFAQLTELIMKPQKRRTTMFRSYTDGNFSEAEIARRVNKHKQAEKDLKKSIRQLNKIEKILSITY